VHVEPLPAGGEVDDVVVERAVGIEVGALEAVELRADERRAGVRAGGLHAALVDGDVLLVVRDLVVRGDPVGDVGAEAEGLGDEVGGIVVNHAPAGLDGGEVGKLHGAGAVGKELFDRTVRPDAPAQRTVGETTGETEILEKGLRGGSAGQYDTEHTETHFLPDVHADTP
jgi:hypothetical protein